MTMTPQQRDGQVARLRAIDPTRMQTTRFGATHPPTRGPYMGLLESWFRYLLNDSYDVAKAGIDDFLGRAEPVAYTRSLLWLHSQLNGMPGNTRDYSLRLTQQTPADRTHKTDLDVFNDVMAGLTDLREKDPLQSALFAGRYRANRNRCAAFDEIVTDETADARQLRRVDVIKAIEQGNKGRYASLFRPDENTGIAALDMVDCQPGVVTVVRVNTHAGQHAIGGNGRTVHCNALGGEMGEKYFNAYGSEGAQYMILFPATGTMVAAQFTTGKHEDEANKSVTIEDLFAREKVEIPPAVLALQQAGERPAFNPAAAPPPQNDGLV